MKRIFVVILAVAVCLPALSGCVQEPDFYDVAVMPNGGEASPGLYQTTFDFDSYKEMIKAFREYDLSKSSYTIQDMKALLGEPYARFVDKVKADKAFPQPMSDGKPLPYQNKEGFSNITFFVSELYDMPWIWYHCLVEGERVNVQLAYPECLGIDVDYSKNAAEILESIAPNAVNLDNWKERPSYKNVYMKEVRIAEGEVSMLIYEINDSEKRMFTFFRDGVIITLTDFGGVVNEDFWAKFSLE